MDDIVIKRVKKGGGHGHHGGAWKVAYADFVTAMMAFFLLLWLLNATTEEQRMGLADFFSPVPGAMQTTTGGKGVTSGETVTAEGQMIQDKASIGVNVMIPEETAPPTESEDITEEEAEEVLDKRDQEQFDEAQDALEEAMAQDAELEELGKSLIIDHTPEGLRIQIVDQEGVAMFKRGSATMGKEARQLIELVVKAVEKLPNKITITGHTDATQYTRYGYDNWDLSTDRANSSRRAMLQAGLAADRIFRVTGRADADLLDKEDPTAPINRRISMVLLRQSYVKNFDEEHKASDIEVLKEIKAEDIEGGPLPDSGPAETDVESAPSPQSDGIISIPPAEAPASAAP